MRVLDAIITGRRQSPPFDTRPARRAAMLSAGNDANPRLLAMLDGHQSVVTLRWAVPIHPTLPQLIPTVLLDLATSE
jgi:hypothetical protein